MMDLIFLLLEQERRLGTAADRLPDLVGQVLWDLAVGRDVQHVVIVGGEDLGGDSGAQRVGLAQDLVNGDPHGVDRKLWVPVVNRARARGIG